MFQNMIIHFEHIFSRSILYTIRFGTCHSLTASRSDWFYKSDFLLSKVIYCIVLLQELCSQNPVFFSCLFPKARELPRCKHEESDTWPLFIKLHICLSWHFKFLCFSFCVRQHIEFYRWQLFILLGITWASPHRRILHAHDSVILRQCFSDLHKLVFRSLSEAHTIV